MYFLYIGDINSENLSGVAFFIAPRVAITTFHQVEPCFMEPKLGIKMVQGSTCLNMITIKGDKNMDYALLEPYEKGFFNFLEPHPLGPSPEGEKCFMLNFSIKVHQQLSIPPSFSVHVGHISSCVDHRLIYDGHSYGGDSGGAIILAKTGKLIAMHLEGINDTPQQDVDAITKEKVMESVKELKKKKKATDEEEAKKISKEDNKISKEGKASYKKLTTDFANLNLDLEVYSVVSSLAQSTTSSCLGLILSYIS
jgi:hypothetical protein